MLINEIKDLKKDVASLEKYKEIALKDIEEKANQGKFEYSITIELNHELYSKFKEYFVNNGFSVEMSKEDIQWYRPSTISWKNPDVANSLAAKYNKIALSSKKLASLKEEVINAIKKDVMDGRSGTNLYIEDEELAEQIEDYLRDGGFKLNKCGRRHILVEGW